VDTIVLLPPALKAIKEDVLESCKKKRFEVLGFFNILTITPSNFKAITGTLAI